MKTTKNHTKNANYFKKSGMVGTVGGALLALSGVLAILGFGFFFWNAFTYLTMSFSLVAGLVLMLFGTLTRASEKDLDSELEYLLRDVDANPERDLKASSRLLPNLSVEIFEGYEYKQGVMLRKDKNGKLRSSQYTRAVLYPQEQRLTVRYRQVSFVSPQYAEKTIEIPYAEITSIELREEARRLTFGKQDFSVSAVTLELKWGNNRLALPAERNLRTEKFVEKIQKKLGESRSE